MTSRVKADLSHVTAWYNVRPASEALSSYSLRECGQGNMKPSSSDGLVPLQSLVNEEESLGRLLQTCRAVLYHHGI